MARGSETRSPSSAIHFLTGVRFPCSKRDLVKCIEDKEAPDEILDFLERLPGQFYQNRQHVMFDIGRMIASCRTCGNFTRVVQTSFGIPQITVGIQIKPPS